MTEEPREHYAYLLRLWKTRDARPPIWRASLEDVHTGERKGFADLQGLLKFLEEWTNEAEQLKVADKGGQL